MTTTSASRDVPNVARANLPNNPRKSSCFTVPAHMDSPNVSAKYGYQIRIWRTRLIPLNVETVRRTCALIEFTDLKTGYSRGLIWTYTAHQIEGWKPIKYRLYGHYGGPRPCDNLGQVWRDTSDEIKFQVKRLKLEHDRKTKPTPMAIPLEEDFPR